MPYFQEEYGKPVFLKGPVLSANPFLGNGPGTREGRRLRASRGPLGFRRFDLRTFVERGWRATGIAASQPSRGCTGHGCSQKQRLQQMHLGVLLVPLKISNSAHVKRLPHGSKTEHL